LYSNFIFLLHIWVVWRKYRNQFATSDPRLQWRFEVTFQ